MKKKIFLTLLILFLLFYVLTFIISFNNISKSVVENDDINLNIYINNDLLQKNLYNSIYNFNLSIKKSINKNISIKNESFEFTGQLTNSYIEKFIHKISRNISVDFSNTKILLYFYQNSNEISIYMEKMLNNFGDFNFEKYMLEKNKKTTKAIDGSKNENSVTVSNTSEIPVNNENIDKVNNKFISNLLKRLQRTNYFFLSSPIHFKIDVVHQNISFIIILRFNGYKWIIQNIKIPYKEI